MYLTIIVLPLLGSIVAGFFGRLIGSSGAHYITTGSVMITTFLSIFAFIEVALNNIPVSFELFRWIDSESINIIWGFNFDTLTVSMLIPVLVVSSLVHLYSIGYMSHDPHNQRFFSYLSLFTFMMIILVTANNYLLMFVGQIYSAVYRRQFYSLLYHRLQKPFYYKWLFLFIIIINICRKTLLKESSETTNGTPLIINLLSGEYRVQTSMKIDDFNTLVKHI